MGDIWDDDEVWTPPAHAKLHDLVSSDTTRRDGEPCMCQALNFEWLQGQEAKCWDCGSIINEKGGE